MRPSDLASSGTPRSADARSPERPRAGDMPVSYMRSSSSGRDVIVRVHRPRFVGTHGAEAADHDMPLSYMRISLREEGLGYRRPPASGSRACIGPRPPAMARHYSHTNIISYHVATIGVHRVVGRPGPVAPDRPGRSAGPSPGRHRAPSSIRSGPGGLLPLRAGQARQAELLDQSQVLPDQGQRMPGRLGRLLR